MAGMSRSAGAVVVSGILAAGVVTGIAAWQTRELRPAVVVLAATTLVVALAAMSMLVLSLVRRSRSVERLVAERTRELADARAAFEAAAAAVDEWLFTLCIHPGDRLELEFEGPGFERLARLEPGSVAPGTTHDVWRSLVHAED